MLFLDWPTLGDASETALVKFFQAIEPLEETRARYPPIDLKDGSKSVVLFNSKNKYAMYIVEYKTKDSDYCLFIKVCLLSFPTNSLLGCTGENLEVQFAHLHQREAPGHR